MYRGRLYGEGTGATFDEDEIYWHPPRSATFRELEWAPWPKVKPGKPGTTKSVLTLREGWETVGEQVHKASVDVGFEAIAVPAGRFDKAWRVDGTSKDRKGSFWWVPSVGFVLMEWAAVDGRKLTLKLRDVRLIESK